MVIRKEHAMAVLAKASQFINLTENDKKRAAQLMEFGIQPLDALHLALAESGKADYFCPCDDKVLQHAQKIKDLSVKVINPVNPVHEIEK